MWWQQEWYSVSSSFLSQFNTCEPNEPASIAQPRLPLQGGRGSLKSEHVSRAMQQPGWHQQIPQHNLLLPSLGISKPLTRFALFFPPSLTLVYSRVASQTEAQLPAQQMSITSNYSCPRCMVAGLCLGANGLQAEQANGAGGRMWAVGACHHGHRGRRFSWWRGSSAPCWAPFRRDNWMGFILLVQMQDGSSLMLTARGRQRSLHRQDAVGRHPGTSFDATPLFVTAQQGLVPASPRAGGGCHLPVSARRPGRLKQD